MHKTIEIDGVVYDSTLYLREQFGFGPNTSLRWIKRGLLPAPVKLGTVNYYQRDKVAELVQRGE